MQTLSPTLKALLNALVMYGEAFHTSNHKGESGAKQAIIDRLTAPKGQQGSVLSRLNGKHQVLLAAVSEIHSA